MANLSTGDLVTDVEDGISTYMPDGETAATVDEKLDFVDALNASLVGDTVNGWNCFFILVGKQIRMELRYLPE